MATALLNGVVSYWKMEGNSNDSLGANNGVDTNIAYSRTTGKINQGMSTTSTGTGTGVNITTSAALRTTGDCSISLWFNLTVDAQGGLFESGGQAGSPYNNFTLWYFTTQGILWRIRDNTGGLPVNIVSAFSTTGVWTHVVGTISGTTATLYVNGVSAGTGTFSGTRNSLTNLTSIGGGFSDSGERILQGDIDEVGFWNRALTQAEVTALYNGGAGLSYPFNSGFLMMM
jgi:hypothetical protein